MGASRKKGAEGDPYAVAQSPWLHYP